MTIKPRLLPVMGAALLSISVAGALSAKEPRLPDQVLTGADDAAVAAPSAARSALARTASVEPTAADLQAKLVQMTSESSEGLEAVNTSEGSKQVNLEDRFMSVMIATPTSDGGVEVSCHTGDHALHAAHVSQQMAAGELPKKAPSVKQQAPAKLEEK